LRKVSFLIKKIAKRYVYILFALLFLGSLFLVDFCLASQLNLEEKGDDLAPVIIVVEGVGEGLEAEISLYLCQKLLNNNFGITVCIIPYLNERELDVTGPLVKNLMGLYKRFPDKITFALEGLKHQKGELDKSLPEQIRILSKAQNIFIRAFNEASPSYNLLAFALIPPYDQYNSYTAACARQAGIKLIIGSRHYSSQGYTLLECDVVEIHPDEKVRMVKDWKSLKIRPPQELVKSAADALKESSPGDPLVMVLNVGILVNQLGKENAQRYIDTIVSLLDQMRKKQKINFITSAQFYYKYIGGPQYIAVRLDDYQTPYKKDLFEKVVDHLVELGIPLTISMIPLAGGRLSQDPEATAYLNNMIDKERIEVALHGYTHEKPEEFTLSLDSQIKILREALEEAKKILWQDEITSLVPPYDAYNEFTSKAIRTVNKEGNKIKIISSKFSSGKYLDKYMFGYDPEGIYHISRTIDPVKSWEPPYRLYSVEEILTMIGYDDAVLVVHPLVLETKQQQDVIIEVIKRLKKRKNVEFVTLRDFYFKIDPALRLALSAWRYFKANTEDSTGLIYPSIISKDEKIYRHSEATRTTMWDIASSLLGILSAEKLGIISHRKGVYRIGRILNFLQHCELYQNRFPNFYYDVTTGKMVKENQGVAWDDVARMLLALRIIKTYYPSLEKICTSITERWDLVALKDLYQSQREEEKPGEINRSPYDAYIDSCFKIWEDKNRLISLWLYLTKKISNLFFTSEPDCYGKFLVPESYILEAIEIGQTKQNEKILNFIYNLQRARYKDKGIMTCLSEGELDREPWFAYCGMLVTKGGFIFWPVTKSIWEESENYPEYRFISSRAAISLHALFENHYSRLCYDLIRKEALNEQYGFYTGVYEDSQELNRCISVNTNGIILESLWFKKRGKRPLINPQKMEVP